jgi:N-terminal acetyltransferase B complex non-catalytic subunit
VKSIQTPQELLLLHRILSTQGRLTESLDAFKDPHLGPTSKVSKGEWVFHIKYLQLLELCGEWKELLAKSFQLLSASRIEDGDGNFPYSRGSDWVVWKALMQAVLELQTPA